MNHKKITEVFKKQDKMTNLFNRGGPIFMSMLSIILLIIITISVFIILAFCLKKTKRSDKKLYALRHLGYMALVFGLLGQIVGLFTAFKAVKMGEVISTPNVFIDGFKVSMITSAYGLFIFSLAILLYWLFNRFLLHA